MFLKIKNFHVNFTAKGNFIRFCFKFGQNSGRNMGKTLNKTLTSQKKLIQLF